MGFGNRIWFWVAVSLCGLLSLMTVAAPWIPEPDKN
jgi:hypothetical protein